MSPATSLSSSPPSTTLTTLTTFPIFLLLPPEIRTHIFALASNSSPRNLDLWPTFERQDYIIPTPVSNIPDNSTNTTINTAVTTNTITTIYTQSYILLINRPSPPPLLSVSRESRKECLRHYELSWKLIYPHPEIEFISMPKWYVNYATDLIIPCENWNVVSYRDFVERTRGKMRRVGICVDWKFWRMHGSIAVSAVTSERKGGGENEDADRDEDEMRTRMFWEEGLQEIILFEDPINAADGGRFRDEDCVYSEAFGIASGLMDRQFCRETMRNWEEEKEKKFSLEFVELKDEELKARGEQLKEARDLLRDYFTRLSGGGDEDEYEESDVPEVDGEDGEIEEYKGWEEEEEEEEEEGGDSFDSTITTLNAGPEWSFSSTAETIGKGEDVRGDSWNGAKGEVGREASLSSRMSSSFIPEIKMMKLVLRSHMIPERDQKA